MPGDLEQLDGAARKRIDSACDFLNHKLADQRKRLTLVAAWATFGGATMVTLLKLPLWGVLWFAVPIFLIFAVRAHNEVRRWFKTMVVQRVIAALGDGYAYTHTSSFTREHFLAMDLFSDRTDIFSSEDEVNGRHKEIAFALHEVRAAKREKRGKNTRTIVFFRGTIVVVEFNKHFYGHTTVVPQAEHAVLSGLFGEFDSRRGRERMSMQDAEFEKAYTVYSTDAQQAHYLLTPKLMQLMLETRAQLGGELRFAFHQNQLYVAVPSTRNRFEVSLFTTRVTPEQVLGDLAAATHLAQNLISGLDLETRIWTRV